jgi:hypothetical protein
MHLRYTLQPDSDRYSWEFSAMRRASIVTGFWALVT